ncbi:MAG: PKD domain-containing protein, partial [Ginsengibacter sp.]
DATVTTVPGDAVSSYMWSFGDGSAPLSTGSNTTAHNYAATGIYAPSLTITTAGGCSNNFAFDTVRFGIPPTNIVAYPLKNTLCGSESATFIGKATNANTYIWDNTETIDIETDTISKHKFSSLGTKNIVVTPAFNGCLGVADSFDVTIIGVIAKFDLKNTCSDKKTFSFDSKSLGNKSSYLWHFDDGSPDEIIADVVHTFPNTGEFSVSLTVDDDITGCSDTKTQKVYTAAPQLNSQDLSICINSSATFTVTDEYANPGSRYIWNVAGKKVGAGTKTSVTVKADKFGTFDNTVIITNGKAYCNDTIQMMSKTIVKGPMLGFTSQDSFCLSTPLIVTNTSKPYLPGDSIVSYIWNFGDGNRDSTFQPGPQEYSIPGRYTLRLEGTDINGCTDVFRKVIRISDDAFVYVLPRVDTLCLGQSDTLIAFQNDNITWSPANLTFCSTCDTITVSPPTTTMFYATSTNTFGCSAMDSVLVKVYNPFNATTATPDVYICLNDSVQIDAGPANYKIMWNPAGGLSDPNSYTPFAFPGVNITYTATLSDSVGCFTSSADVNVHLKSLPGVDAGPDQVFPFNSPFTLMPVYGNNVVSYLWSPANQLNCTTCANASGTILKKETYTIAVTSDSGCVSKDEITIFVECKDSNVLLPNAFTPNNDNINDYFYPLTRGIDRVLNFAIYSREGKRVYQKQDFPPNDKTYGWDGNVKGASPSTAVYVYVLDVLCDSGERISKKGSVILIR